MPVYFVQSGRPGPTGGAVKIGFSTAVHSRLVKIQTDAPESLFLLRILDGGEELEAALHARFAALRQRGEWFQFSAEMLGDLGAPDLSLEKPRVVRSGERKTWTAEARARQSSVQLAHFADPVKGAERRRRMRETQLAQLKISSVRELAVRAGGWGRFAKTLELPPEVVLGWHKIPMEYLQVAAAAAKLPPEKIAHLSEAA